MDKKRLLIVTQEMEPYIELSAIANVSRQLPQYAQEQGMEIRILMQRFGNINERRNRLHEVVRLSGINIIINNDDYPLIIKVATLPTARIQVYFLDNEDLFNGKEVFHDSKKKFYDDNAERMIFFCKGVLETVKKFGWAPDIIHCLGWMTSLIPLYVKTTYQNEPIFSNSKVVYSLYEKSFKENLGKDFIKKIPSNNSIDEKELDIFDTGDFVNLAIGAIQNADAVIKGNGSIDKKILSSIDNKKPVLDHVNGDEYLESYHGFYKQLLDAK
ncbi:MAG: glycogen/starch synthase [Bacteroidetes bacterium]|nr:glycogen/starch synthase [Bacteroidota bacterium]